jgi:DNA-binding transcriptional ArsR family regulator
MRPAADSSVFQAIASDPRRALLSALAAGERSVTELVAVLGTTQPAVSQHLAVLRSARLVEERAIGRRRMYRLRAQPLAEVASWTEQFRQFWEERLDAIGVVLDSLDTPDDDQGDPP